MTVLVERNTTVPVTKSETFSTASDNQSAVTVRVFQGERPMANDNRLLGQFNLEGIPPAPRGMPQIEVTFDIDANGILHVNAKDKATGKESKITIKASSGLTEDEIQRMVKDAASHADEDKRQLELVTARNQADQLLHGVRKSLAEYGDKVDAAEKARIEEAAKELEAVLKKDDKAAIEAKSQALAAASQKLGERIYADAQAKAQPGAAPGGGADEGRGRDENVVDAEYTEVKDKKSA